MRTQNKEAALRDVPYLLRGVGLNLKDTMQTLKQDIARRAFNPLDTSVPRDQRLKTLEQMYPGHNFATALRYADLLTRQGVPPHEITERFAQNNFLPRYQAYATAPMRAAKDLGVTGPAEERLKTRTAQAMNVIHPLQALLANHERRVPSQSASLTDRANAMLDAGDARTGSYLTDPAQQQTVGLRPMQPTLVNRAFRKVLGEAINLDNATEIDVGGRNIRVGAPRSYINASDVPAYAVPLLPLVAAKNLEALAHELGHQTGNPLVRSATKALYAPGLVPGLGALRFPEELRAQAGAEDILDRFRSAGAPVRPKLQDMTDEELREHTLPLTTYADSAIREPVSMFYSALDKLKRRNIYPKGK